MLLERERASLNQFFREAPESIETNNSGQKKCKYCHKWFMPQGYATHINFHISHGDKQVLPGGLPKFGKAKIRDGTKSRIVASPDDDLTNSMVRDEMVVKMDLAS
jgi:hypothetical protein